MKNKTKKILSCVVLMITLFVSALFMTGCAMTQEQEQALNVITKNTETLVDSFSSYLEGQNKKLDKETAYDMLRQAKLKSRYVLEENNIAQLNMTQSWLFPQHEPLNDVYLNVVYDFSSDNKKVMVSGYNPDSSENETMFIGNYYAEDATKNYLAYYNDGQPTLSAFNESMISSWIFSQIDPLEYIGVGAIYLDEITRVVVNDNGEYTFNIIKTSVGEGRLGYSHTTYYMEIVVKDYLFKSVDVKAFVRDASEHNMLKDINGEFIDDGYGGYVCNSSSHSQVIHLKADYKYGNDVSLEDINAKISEINAKIENGDLVLPNN